MLSKVAYIACNSVVEGSLHVVCNSVVEGGLQSLASIAEIFF